MSVKPPDSPMVAQAEVLDSALDYAPAGGVWRGRPDVLPRCRALAGWLVVLTASSGTCVWSCFPLARSLQARMVVQIVTFGVTMGVAVWVSNLSRKTRDCRSASKAVTVSEFAALCGLIGLGVLPAMAMAKLIGFAEGKTIASLSFMLLGGSAWRHAVMYQRYAHWATLRQANSVARSLKRLGRVKAVYETSWLCLCGITLALIHEKLSLYGNSSSENELGVAILAFVCLLLTGGFLVLWVWTMVAHVRLLRVMR